MAAPSGRALRPGGASTQSADDLDLVIGFERMVERVSEFLAHDEADVRPDPILLVHDAEPEARVLGVQEVENGAEGVSLHLDPGASARVRAQGRRDVDAHQAGIAVVTERT